MSEDAVTSHVTTGFVDARVGHEGTRIDLDDVSKRYRIGDVEVTALDGINLHVDEAPSMPVSAPGDPRTLRGADKS